MSSKEAKWNIRCFPIWRIIISGCFFCSAWFFLLNVLKRSLTVAWIYEMHNAVLNLCHGLKIYKQKIIFYCVWLHSCIVVIRFCTWMWQPIWLLRTRAPLSTFSSMAVDPMRSRVSLSQMSMCMVWRARYRRNQRFSPGLRKLLSTLNCNCRPGEAEQRTKVGLIAKSKSSYEPLLWLQSQCFTVNMTQMWSWTIYAVFQPPRVTGHIF